MAELQDRGLIRHLGVSNFPSAWSRRRSSTARLRQPGRAPPVPRPAGLLRPGREHDLLLEAYSPFAHGRLLDDPVLAEIGEAHGKSAGQVALRWLLDQPQVCALPKASSHERREQNLDVFDFELGDEERERIDGLDRGLRTADPSFAPEWDA
jgi:2,5-diketo-D-gluconate reductase B